MWIKRLSYCNFRQRSKVRFKILLQPNSILSRDGNAFNASLAHIACENGDLEMLKLLREKYNIDLEAEDKEQATPIFYAAR